MDFYYNKLRQNHCMPYMGGGKGVCGYGLGLKTTHLTEQQHTQNEGRTLIPLENILDGEY